MLELLNIRINFLCRKTYKNEDNKYPIVLRIVYRNERRDVFTGLYCDQQEWDKRNNRLFRLNKHAIAINANLDLVQRKTFETFESLKYSGIVFTIDELVDKIKGKDEKPTLLNEYLEEEKARLKKRLGIDITPATYDKYRRSASHVQAFLQLEYKVKTYPIQRIDVTFLEKYFQYLRGVRNISHNSSIKYVTFFKTILMPAMRAGILKTDPFKDLRLKQKPVSKGYLTQEEIDKLVEVDLRSHDLQRVRDIFLLSCYTGLAYSDIKQLAKHHILKEGEDSFFIRKPRQKTGQESVIPMLPAARRILQKYSPTNDFRDFMWHVSSNQKMNQRLKTIGAMAGIEKALHMHLARHTFATTITLSNGVPIESVSSMLGHASLKQTQHYAKIISFKLRNDMAKISGLYQ
jgi:site-specific recombinase XerD